MSFLAGKRLGIAFSILLSACLLGYSCSRGGENETSLSPPPADGGPRPDNPPDPSDNNPPSEGDVPQTRLFFNSGSISALDPASPTDTLLFESGVTNGEIVIFHGTWDAPNMQVSGLHGRTLIYAKSDGTLQKVSGLKGDLAIPSQVSNENQGADICRIEAANDFADHDNSPYIYELPGTDSKCDTLNDNIWKMVRIGMDRDETPLIAKEPLDMLFGSDGAILGSLAIEGSDIVRCDVDFQDCTSVSPFTAIVKSLASQPFIGHIIFQIDEKIHDYNVDTGILSPLLYELLSGASVLPSIADATNLYFGDGGILLKIPLDGSSNAITLTSEVISIGSDISLSTDRVIYTISGLVPPINSIKAIGKDGVAPITLVASSDSLSIHASSGRFIYYERSGNEGTFSGVIKEDGTGGAEEPDATWVGESMSTIVSSIEPDIVRIFRVEGCSVAPPFPCAGGILKSFDASTNSNEVGLGQLPPDIDSIFISGFGNDLLGTGSGPLVLDDIFYVKKDLADSLARATNTRNIAEFPIDGLAGWSFTSND